MISLSLKFQLKHIELFMHASINATHY